MAPRAKKAATASAVAPKLAVLKLSRFPDPIPAPGADNPELITDGSITDLSLPTRVQDKLDNLFAEWDALDQQIKALKAEQEERKAELGELLDSRSLKAVTCDSLSVRWVHSSNSTLDKLKLLENGVAAAVIDASTKRTLFRSLRVTNPVRAAQEKAAKEAEGGGGGGE